MHVLSRFRGGGNGLEKTRLVLWGNEDRISAAAVVNS